MAFEGNEEAEGEQDKRIIKDAGLTFEDRTRTCNDPDFVCKERGACVEIKYRSESLFFENEWRSHFEKMQTYDKRYLVVYKLNWPHLEECSALAKVYGIKVNAINILPLLIQECKEDREAYSLIRFEPLKILKSIAMDLWLTKIWKRVFKLVNRLIAKASSSLPTKNTCSTQFPTEGTNKQGSRRIVHFDLVVHEVARKMGGMFEK